MLPKNTASSKKTKRKSSLYTPLPAEVLQITESTSNDSLTQKLLDILPASDTHQLDADLKSYVGIKCSKKVSKCIQPRSMKTALSQRERRRLGLFNCNNLRITYEEALGMNRLWKSYMLHSLNSNLFSKCGNESYNSSLLKADYHGALLTVISSKCPSLVGHSGIVVYETLYTFKIVEKNNTLKTISKKPCIFEFVIGTQKFKILGAYFCMRSSERPTKKIKSTIIPVL